MAVAAGRQSHHERDPAAPGRQPDRRWQLFLARETDREYDVDHQGDRFFMRINDTGRNFRLVTAPEDDWKPATGGSCWRTGTR